MTEALIYVAFLCFLFLATFLESFQCFFAVLLILWTVRLICLKNKKVLFLALICSVLFAGRVFNYRQAQRTTLSGTETSFQLKVDTQTVRVQGDYLTFVGRMVEKPSEKLRVTTTLEHEEEAQWWSELSEVPEVQIEGALKRPEAARHLHGFNYRTYLKRQHIHWLLTSEEKIEVVQLHRSWKTRVSHRIGQYIAAHFPEKTGAYLTLFILGSREQLPPEVLNDYRDLGVIHLLSLSGMHLSFFFRMLATGLLFLGVTHETTHLVSLFLFPLFGSLTGWGTSIFRAIGQASLKHLSLLLKVSRRYPLDEWALTALVWLFIQPAAIYTVAFQLSFGLSLLFILFNQWERVGDYSVFFWSLLRLGGSFMLSALILSYHFFEFSIFALVAQWLLVPIFAFFIFPGLIILLLTSLPLHCFSFFSHVTAVFDKFLHIFEKGLAVLGRLGRWQVVIGRLPGVILVLLAGYILYMLVCLDKKRRPSLTLTLGATLLFFYHRLSPVGTFGMIDVGQGDSLFIKPPFSSQVTLIDTGGRVPFVKEETWRQHSIAPLGERTVIPALKALGVTAIDTQIITHADADHCAEIGTIHQELPIKHVYATSQTFQDEMFQTLAQTLKTTDFQEASGGQKIETAAGTFHVLHPVELVEDYNESSLVMYTEIGGKRWLLTGDAGVSSEEKWLTRYPERAVDVLKVGHHGSQTATSEDLLNAYRPHEAWISVGQNNRFNHPHPDVVERLEHYQIKIYRTDQQGSVYYYYGPLSFMHKTRTVTALTEAEDEH